MHRDRTEEDGEKVRELLEKLLLELDKLNVKQLNFEWKHYRIEIRPSEIKIQ